MYFVTIPNFKNSGQDVSEKPMHSNLSFFTCQMEQNDQKLHN